MNGSYGNSILPLPKLANEDMPDSTPCKSDTSWLNLLEIGLIPEHRSLVILGTEQVDDAVEEKSQ